MLYVALTRAKARLYLPRYPAAFDRQLRGCYHMVNERLHAIGGGFTAPETKALFHVVPVPCPGEAPPAAAPAAAAVLAAWHPAASLLAPAPADDELRDLARARAGFLMTSYSAVKRLHGGFVPRPSRRPTPPPTSRCRCPGSPWIPRSSRAAAPRAASSTR